MARPVCSYAFSWHTSALGVNTCAAGRLAQSSASLPSTPGTGEEQPASANGAASAQTAAPAAILRLHAMCRPSQTSAREPNGRKAAATAVLSAFYQPGTPLPLVPLADFFIVLPS
ncbi:hypothetical protein GCM10009662_19940 [Catellatospora coxensis]|uniref:Uncharacterized protein n=1 Tax=Catellatospora coxensis TaxID=310354 RepID=A0A8J3KZ53_9ACTN|nr:hypothetical protein Cco03nite_55780 [Catellatospora coxensis]